MSFGFSIGDFIAVRNTIAQITVCLKGAGSEYQELIRELEALEKALQHIDRLQPSNGNSTDLDPIKYAAPSCRQPLEQFLSKVRKYERSLGVWMKSSAVLRVTDKVRFRLGKKDEIRKLQNYLNVHVGTINVLAE